jgi:transcriptional regulator with XRE-family HTH domain
MEIREAFATNLRLRRRAAGLSQEELADRAGIDRTYVSALERGVYSATIDMVDKLAKVLGAEAAELLAKPARARRS